MPNTKPDSDPFEQGEIVWVDFPFSDKPSASKKRPALIVSNRISNQLDNDLLVVPLTSTIRQDPFSILIAEDDVETPLPVQSEIRCNKIFTIRTSLVLNKLTVLRQECLRDVIQKVRECVAIEETGKLVAFPEKTNE